MSDIGGGGFGEVNIGGTFQANRRGGGFRRMMGGGQGVTGTVQAGLKFDIPGLKSFRTELSNITSAMEKLSAAFSKAAKAPADWAKALEAANKQLVAMKTNAQGVNIGGAAGTTGVTPTGTPTPQGLINSSGQRTSAAPSTSMGQIPVPPVGPGGPGGPPAGPGGGGGMGPQMAAQGGQALGQMAAAGLGAMTDRFNRNMNAAGQADVYMRMAGNAMGMQTRQVYGFLGQPWQNLPGGIMGTQMEQGQFLAQSGAMGAQVGGPGLSGTRGQAFARSTGFLQNTTGMDLGTATNVTSQMMSNVSGIKRSYAMFGSAAMPYTQGGGMKDLPTYFKGILDAIAKNAGMKQPITKEQLMAQQFPGSNFQVWLDMIFGDQPDLKDQFWQWAIGNAQAISVGAGPLSSDPATLRGQMKKVQGKTLSQQMLKTTARDTQREDKFTQQQYDAMIQQEQTQRKLIGALQHLDSTLQSVYHITGPIPPGITGMLQSGLQLGGEVAGMAAMAAFIADPGYMNIGDAEGGTSHLTPDLKKRVNAMMAANPNLRVASAYRDNVRQDRLHKGGGPFAPSGKSAHGQGRAVDIGPTSQYGWLAANAKKFGLGTAGHMGEPWHVQLSGTLGFMGDPPSPQEAANSALMQQMQSNIGTFVARNIAASQAAASSTATGSTTDTTNLGAAFGSTATAAGAAAGGATAGGGDFSVTMKPGKDPHNLFAYLNTPTSLAQEVTALHNAGFTGVDLFKMAAIGMRESAGGTIVYTKRPSTGDWSWGMWGMNDLNTAAGHAELLGWIQAAGGKTMEDYYNVNLAAKAARSMWVSNTNNHYRPWGAYKGMNEMTGTDPKVYAQAQAFAAQMGYGDAGYAVADNSGWGGGSSTNTTSVRGGVTFNNTFHVTLNGGNTASIDVATRQIASRLEAQLRRAVARDA